MVFNGLSSKRRGGRAVECTSLENWRAFAGSVSSNLTLSANKISYPLVGELILLI